MGLIYFLIKVLDKSKQKEYNVHKGKGIIGVRI